MIGGREGVEAFVVFRVDEQKCMRKKHKSTHIQLTNDLSLNGSGARRGRGNGSRWSDGGGRQVAPVASQGRAISAEEYGNWERGWLEPQRAD